MSSNIFELAAQAAPGALDFVSSPIPTPNYTTLLDNILGKDDYFGATTRDWHTSPGRPFTTEFEKLGLVPVPEAARELKIAQELHGPIDSWDQEKIRLYDKDIASISEYYRRTTQNDEGQSQGLHDYLDEIEMFGGIGRFNNAYYDVDQTTGDKTLKPEAFEYLDAKRKHKDLLKAMAAAENELTPSQAARGAAEQLPFVGKYIAQWDASQSITLPRLLQKFDDGTLEPNEYPKLAQLLTTQKRNQYNNEENTAYQWYRNIRNTLESSIEIGGSLSAARSLVGGSLLKAIPLAPVFNPGTYADTLRRVSEGKDWTTAVTEGYVSSAIQTGTEVLGAKMLGKAWDKLKGVMGKAPTKAAAATGISAWMKDTGVYSTFLGEMGEERLQEVISGTASLATGLDLGDYGVTGAIATGDMQPQHWEQLLLETITIGTFAGANKAMNWAQSKSKLDWLKENLDSFPALKLRIDEGPTLTRGQMDALGIPKTSKADRESLKTPVEPEAPAVEQPVQPPEVQPPTQTVEPTVATEPADPNNFLETLPGDQRAEAGLKRLRPDAAGQPVRVFQGIILDKSNRNKGRGQWMILNELAQNPEHWYWNSQAFDQLAKSLGRLRDDGLIDLTIRLRQGGEFTAKITEKGKKYVEKRRQGVFNSVNKELQTVRAELDALLDKVEAGNERLERTLRDNRRVLESVNFLPPEAFTKGQEGYRILAENGVSQKTIDTIRQEMEAGEKLKPEIAPLQEKWRTLSAQARELGMRQVDIDKGMPSETVPPVETPDGISPQQEVPDHENPLFTQQQKSILPDPNQQRAVPIDMLGRMAGAGKKFWKKYFTMVGDIPAEIFEEKLVRDGRFSKLQKQIEFSLRALNNGKKEVFGSKNIPDAENAKLNAALKGQIPLTQLPAPLRAPILRMRNEIDALSRLMQQNGMVQGDLAVTFANNEGSYLHRAYRIFHEPRFAEKIPEANKNAVRAYLRQEFPNWTDNQIEQTLGELMFRGEESPTIPGLIRGSSLGEKDLTALFKRKDIAPEIRALWGEYQDPAVNYANTLHKMGRMIANHQFLENVATQFYGTYFWQKDDPNIDPRAVAAIDDTNSMSPLNGLYTLPEIKEAFEQQKVGKLDDGFMNGLLRMYLKAIALPKYTKTVLSSMTHIRNFLSGVTLSIANGHLPTPANLKKAAQATAFQTFSGKNDPQKEAYAERLAELGITGESVHAGELKGVFRDSETAAIDEILGKDKSDKLRQAYGKIAEAYQAEDTFWKIYQFEAEKAQYMEADPSMTEADAELLAARIVSNQTPTYSRIPKGLKNLRYLPFAPFINFQVEMWRVTKNIATQASKELQDPKLRKIGAKRLAGLIVGVSAFEVLAHGLMAAFGITGDDDEDMRLFMPEWSKHSAFGYSDRIEGGNASGFDFSYMDPFDTLKRPLRALFAGEEGGLVEATKEIFRPFGNEGLFTSRVIDIMRNSQLGNGAPVFNPQDDFGTKLKNIVWHLYEGIEPGELTKLRRDYDALTGRVGSSGKAPSLKKELLARMTGLRAMDINIPQSLIFQSSAFVSDMRDAEQILRRPATNKGTVSDSELASAYLRSENARRALFDGMQHRVEAALRLGVPEAEIKESLEKGRVAKSDIDDLFSGTYRSYVPTKIGPRQIEVLSLAMEQASEETRRQITGEIAYAATSPTDSEDQQAAMTALMQAENLSYSEVREILREEFLRRSEKKRITPAFNARIEKLGRAFRSK